MAILMAKRPTAIKKKDKNTKEKTTPKKKKIIKHHKLFTIVKDKTTKKKITKYQWQVLTVVCGSVVLCLSLSYATFSFIKQYNVWAKE